MSTFGAGRDAVNYGVERIGVLSGLRWACLVLLWVGSWDAHAHSRTRKLAGLRRVTRLGYDMTRYVALGCIWNGCLVQIVVVYQPGPLLRTHKGAALAGFGGVVAFVECEAFPRCEVPAVDSPPKSWALWCAVPAQGSREWEDHTEGCLIDSSKVQHMFRRDMAGAGARASGSAGAGAER